MSVTQNSRYTHWAHYAYIPNGRSQKLRAWRKSMLSATLCWWSQRCRHERCDTVASLLWSYERIFHICKWEVRTKPYEWMMNAFWSSMCCRHPVTPPPTDATDATAAPKTLSFIRVLKLICDCNKKSYHVVIFNKGIPPKLNSESMTSVCRPVLCSRFLFRFG